MKLATLKNNTLDGELVVVSKDLSKARKASHVAESLRVAVEQWDQVAPALDAIYSELNAGGEGFVPNWDEFHSPLPRSFAFLDGSAYIQHIKLVRKARNADLPEKLLTLPLMYQGTSDTYLAPTEDIPMVHFDHGVDFEGEVGVITDFIEQGTKAKDAEKAIRLLVLINDVSLRGLIPEELKQGFGFLQSKPSSAFAPVAVTPDELGDHWRDGRIHLPLNVTYNGSFFGDADAGAMHFSFGELLQHAARTRDLGAGTILGSGTVSNEDESRGSSCLAEKRMLEKIKTGEFSTPFMQVGDTIHMEMKMDGASIFGAVDQKVVPAKNPE